MTTQTKTTTGKRIPLEQTLLDYEAALDKELGQHDPTPLSKRDVSCIFKAAMLDAFVIASNKDLMDHLEVAMKGDDKLEVIKQVYQLVERLRYRISLGAIFLMASSIPFRTSYKYRFYYLLMVMRKADMESVQIINSDLLTERVFSKGFLNDDLTADLPDEPDAKSWYGLLLPRTCKV